jgi:hypothetical protein
MNERDTRKVDKIKYAEKRKYFEMSTKELKKLQTEGSDEATKELKRRTKKRKQKKRTTVKKT